MKKQPHTAKQNVEKKTGLSGAVPASVSDDELYASQQANDKLFISLSSAISEIPGTYECFGVRLSVMDAYDDKHEGIKRFVQIHAVLPETGLLQRLEPESRFLLQDLLYPTMGEISEKDFGLKALCHHFHNQPLFTRMLAAKSERDRHIVDEVSSSRIRKPATSAR